MNHLPLLLYHPHQRNHYYKWLNFSLCNHKRLLLVYEYSFFFPSGGNRHVMLNVSNVWFWNLEFFTLPSLQPRIFHLAPSGWTSLRCPKKWIIVLPSISFITTGQPSFLKHHCTVFMFLWTCYPPESESSFYFIFLNLDSKFQFCAVSRSVD